MGMAVLRRTPHVLRMTSALVALVLTAACANPTPLPGAFETALAATVEVGSTAVAQAFVDQRATLTAGAPTLTQTSAPSATPSATPLPTGTPTPRNSATSSATATEAAT